MNKKRIVITGLGVISAVGIGRDVFIDNIFKGVSGIKPISSFDTATFKAKLAAEVRDFKPEEILGPKGLRTLDRSIKLISSTAQLALDDSGVKITEENAQDAGVAVAATLGSISSISDFDKEGIKEGPRYVNPALFPNTVINSPASQVSIRFNLKAFNVTIATGYSASLDAISYAMDALRFERAKIVLAGGVEEFCIQTFLGFYKAGCLAGSNAAGGITLGEGAGIVILESLESAQARKAKIYAEVSGFGTGLQDFKKAMQMSMEEANIGIDKVDLILSAANSTKESDLNEAKAIKDVFQERAADIPVSAIKTMTGEVYSASGALQVAAAIGAIERQIRIDNVLVNSGGASGCNSSLILSRFKGN